MHKPWLSIVIPTRNSSSTLAACLQSIHHQTYIDFEVIIIDGASTDETLSIVETERASFSAITIISEPDKGIYDAMNKGTNVARGEWMYFLGSDDRLYAPDTLARLAFMTQETKGNMIYGNVMIEGDSFWAKNEQVFDGPYSLTKLVQANICHQAIVYRRSQLLKNGGYNLRYPLCADWDMNLKFFAQGPVQYVDQVIAYFSASGKSSAPSRDLFYEHDIVLNLQTYFGWTAFNSHFTFWKHHLKKYAGDLLKSGSYMKALVYLTAYQYHKTKG